MRKSLVNTHSLSLLLFLVHLVDFVDLDWVLVDVHWPIILTVLVPLDDSSGDGHGLLPAEGCCQGEAVRQMLLVALRAARRFRLLVRVVDGHVV